MYYRKNHQHALESLESSLEAEQRGKADAIRAKKKLESEINELEAALDSANRGRMEAEKNVKKHQQAITELRQQIEDEHRAREEADKQVNINHIQKKNLYTVTQFSGQLMFMVRTVTYFVRSV